MRIGNAKSHAVALFLADKSIRRVTLFIDPKTVFRLTRRTHKNKAGKRTVNKYSTDAVLTYGRPNYLEKAIIKKTHKGWFPMTLVKKVA